MTVQEFDTALSELETRVDRLRALYENWFRGYEKMEPSVARKDVERRVYGLRKELPRNTALRFRYHQLYQRYTTLATYWQRTARQIEEGTYRLQLQRMKRRRVDDDLMRTNVPPPRGEDEETLPPPAYELSMDETLDVQGLMDAADIEQVARVIEAAGPHSNPPPRGPIPSIPLSRSAPQELLAGAPAPLGQVLPTVKSARFARPTAANDSVVPKPPAPAAAVSAPAAAASAPPAAPASSAAAGAPARPSMPKPPPLKIPPPNGAGTGTMPSLPAGPNARPVGPPAVPPPRPSTGTGTMPGLPPPISAHAPEGALRRPGTGSMPGLPRPLITAKPSLTPAAAPPLGASASPSASAPKPPSPGPASPMTTTAPGRMSTPPRTEAAGAQPTLSEQRLRRLYDEYTAARRKNNEGEVRFETLASSIQKMLPDLSKKHQGKQIDFEVVLKDGRVGLKPKAT